MQQELDKPTPKSSDINLLQIFFLSAPPNPPISSCLLSKAISGYQRLFGYNTDIQHVFVAVNGWCYELTTQGLVKYEYTPKLLFMERLVAVYNVSVDKEVAEQMLTVLERQYSNKPKLNLLECVKYAAKVAWCKLMYKVDVEVNSELPKYATVKEHTLYFNLPYTCVTLPTLLLQMLLPEYELDYDDHLPVALFVLTNVLACDLNEGFLWQKLQ